MNDKYNLWYNLEEEKDIKPFSGGGLYDPDSLPKIKDPFYPNKKIKKIVETDGALSLVPVDTDILEPSRDNPLFYLLGFRSVDNLKKYIEKHRDHLRKVQRNQLEHFISGLKESSLERQLKIVNECISEAGSRKAGKSLAGESLTAWDEVFKEQMIQERERIKDSIKEQESKPRDEKDAEPAEEWEWIENEYSKNMSMFNNDQEWAKATTTKFKDVFNTKKGSPSSMLRYGKYKGRN